MKKVSLITDGACSGNPGPGGWAALMRYNHHEKHIAGGNPHTTNNQMEMTAIIEGLRMFKERVEVLIITDSRYVIDGFEKGWIDSWKSNDWRTSANKPVKNKELWIDLENEIKRHKVTFMWVKGHNGHEDNEFVDKLAREQAEKFQKPLGKLDI